VDGELCWFSERGGRSLLTFTDDPDASHAAAVALAELVSSRRVPALLVERANGVSVLTPDGPATAALDALVEAGFSRTPRGLRLR